ncbi:Rgg/GadR/MutR family transcriptional regulator [Lactobacillus sp. XV13L]|nr:Rgg/GadR/MutR family transcriptional regulator [Lactobacillus sp. XV13L]
MTIGELLKKYRVEQMKTQKQWVGNIISPSFYAKVEKNIHRITVEDLLALLHYNKILAIDFFKRLDQNDKNNYEFEKEIINQIVDAYYQQSKSKLEQIRRMVIASNLPDKDEQLAFITGYIALLDNDFRGLDEQTKVQIKNRLFNISDFDRNDLYLYCNFMSFYDLDSNLMLSKRLIRHFKDDSDVIVQKAILSIISNLLIFCITANRYDETTFFIEAAQQININPDLAFYRGTLVVFESLIASHYQQQKNNLEDCQTIIDFFNLIGMREYSEQLQDFMQKGGLFD